MPNRGGEFEHGDDGAPSGISGSEIQLQLHTIIKPPGTETHDGSIRKAGRGSQIDFVRFRRPTSSLAMQPPAPVDVPISRFRLPTGSQWKAGATPGNVGATAAWRSCTIVCGGKRMSLLSGQVHWDEVRCFGVCREI